MNRAAGSHGKHEPRIPSVDVPAAAGRLRQLRFVRRAGLRFGTLAAVCRLVRVVGASGFFGGALKIKLDNFRRGCILSLFP